MPPYLCWDERQAGPQDFLPVTVIMWFCGIIKPPPNVPLDRQYLLLSGPRLALPGHVTSWLPHVPKLIVCCTHELSLEECQSGVEEATKDVPPAGMDFPRVEEGAGCLVRGLPTWAPREVEGWQEAHTRHVQRVKEEVEERERRAAEKDVKRQQRAATKGGHSTPGTPAPPPAAPPASSAAPRPPKKARIPAPPDPTPDLIPSAEASGEPSQQPADTQSSEVPLAQPQGQEGEQAGMWIGGATIIDEGDGEQSTASEGSSPRRRKASKSQTKAHSKGEGRWLREPLPTTAVELPADSEGIQRIVPAVDLTQEAPEASSSSAAVKPPAKGGQPSPAGAFFGHQLQSRQPKGRK